MNKLIIEKVVRGGSILGYVVIDFESKKELYQNMYIEKCFEYIKQKMEE